MFPLSFVFRCTPFLDIGADGAVIFFVWGKRKCNMTTWIFQSSVVVLHTPFPHVGDVFVSSRNITFFCRGAKCNMTIWMFPLSLASLYTPVRDVGADGATIFFSEKSKYHNLNACFLFFCTLSRRRRRGSCRNFFGEKKRVQHDNVIFCVVSL